MSLKLNRTAFGTRVQIAVSGEAGIVTGFALHMRSRTSNQFLVEYKGADGCAREAWFHQDQLEVLA